ncbi:hypothetical protein Hanom_Chr16g01463941 [Helianthus anomalus]
MTLLEEMKLLKEMQDHHSGKWEALFITSHKDTVNRKKDVLPIPDFGTKPSRHPNEFFCKTIVNGAQNDTSLPRVAACLLVQKDLKLVMLSYLSECEIKFGRLKVFRIHTKKMKLSDDVWSFTNGFMRVLQLSVRRKHKEEVDTARIHKVM